jgi:four helix bundle protein
MDGQNFKGLKVWQLGMILVEDIYCLSRQLPKTESYGLISQIQRAAVSIPANIAEGHATGSTKDFLRYLAIAQGSLAELETHLLIATRIKYTNKLQTDPILNKCSEEARMLRALRKHVRNRINN